MMTKSSIKDVIEITFKFSAITSMLLRRRKKIALDVYMPGMFALNLTEGSPRAVSSRRPGRDLS
jgi:hypothetical protein